MLLQMTCTVHLLHAGDGWCMCLHSCVQGLCTQECNGGNGVLLQIMILAAAAAVWAIRAKVPISPVPAHYIFLGCRFAHACSRRIVWVTHLLGKRSTSHYSMMLPPTHAVGATL